MNIATNHTSVLRNFSNYVSPLSSLSHQQKRILAIMTAAIALFAVAYVVFRCCKLDNHLFTKKKDDAQAKNPKLDNKKLDVADPVLDDKKLDDKDPKLDNRN